MMRNIGPFSVLAIDIDGTLLGNNKQPGNVTKDVVTRMKSVGYLVGIASGRKLNCELFEMIRGWGFTFDFDFVIGNNGYELYDNLENKVSYYYPEMRNELLTGLLKECIASGFPYYYKKKDSFIFVSYLFSYYKKIFGRTTLYDSKYLHISDALNNHYNYVFRYLASERKKINIIKEIKNEEYVAIETFPGRIEIINRRINKGTTLQLFCNKHNLDMKNVISFGDMDNDIEMLRLTGFGVCMKNGSKKAKQNADDITQFKNTEDGVGKYLQKLL